MFSSVILAGPILAGNPLEMASERKPLHKLYCFHIGLSVLSYTQASSSKGQTVTKASQLYWPGVSGGFSLRACY